MRTPKSHVIREVIKRLERTYRPVRVVLFGSHATGRPRRHSDIDLLIVKRTSKPFHRRLFEVRRLASPVLKGRPFDPIVMTPAEVGRRLKRGDQFVKDILEHGQHVYVRP